MTKYTPTKWQDSLFDEEGNRVQKGTALSADNLNKIEQGVKAADDKVDVIQTEVNKLPKRSEFDAVTQKLADTALTINQGSSFVEKLLPLLNIRSMYVKNNVLGDGVDVGLVMENVGDSVIEYNFKLNPDNLLLLRGSKSGTITPSRKELTPVTDGTFIESSYVKYTTTIGDSFSFAFKGTQLEFQVPGESRGGLWEFELNNGTRKRVSCYVDSASLKPKLIMVFGGMPYGEYFGKATFLGDDPNNPPSSSPSRGYIYNSDTTWALREENKNGFLDTSTAKNMISPNTIPDFAITARLHGEANSYTWVPVHSIPSVSLNVFRKLLIDGVDRNPTSGKLLDKDYTDVKSFEIAQSFNARNPKGTAENMWEHFISHSVSRLNPFCEIKNRLKVLKKTSIDSAYLAMVGVDTANFSRLALNSGVEYDSVPADGSEIALGYDVSSVLYAGEYVAGRTHGVALDVLSYTEAVGLKKRNLSSPEMPGLLTFRADNVAKFYLRALPNNSTLEVGQILKNTHRIACVTGIQFPNTLLKNI